MDVLRVGSRGFKVQYLQRLLNKAPARDHAAGTRLSEDGSLGPLTEAAVRSFQGEYLLNAPNLVLVWCRYA